MKYITFLLLFVFVASSTLCYSQTSKPRRDKKVKTSEAEVVDSLSTKKKAKKHVEGKTEDQNKTISLGACYLFGVATGYADSVTMVTNICRVDGMEGRLQEKTPIGIDLYTKSLKDYLAGIGKKGYVCTTFVCTSRKEAEQRLVAVRNNVMQKKTTALMPIGDFEYKYISTKHIFSNEEKETEDTDDDF